MSDFALLFQEQKSEDWLNTLPSYQKQLVHELLASNGADEDAAVQTLLESSVDQTSPFSGQQGENKKYAAFFKDEIRKFICGSPTYESERNEVTNLLKNSTNKDAVVSIISSVIGAKLGLAFVVIAPVVVLTLMALTKTSINAWCKMSSTE